MKNADGVCQSFHGQKDSGYNSRTLDRYGSTFDVLFLSKLDVKAAPRFLCKAIYGSAKSWLINKNRGEDSDPVIKNYNGFYHQRSKICPRKHLNNVAEYAPRNAFWQSRVFLPYS
ncbi:hypothetical protein HBA55_30805 [Pseudomaricurvus alkylphenolicus]|uniref:hypothetical protein n=1 Tax=Pseudomaricurvus alkylphenolicus TaxID=1306991 RepID=UPI001423AC0D|nr:hypothetical protein [Pseudomaricurvus alkylphenolicus]NIB44032.1 hypothetical protein [Pseudomaricurvus alkylphenolicus]